MTTENAYTPPDRKGWPSGPWDTSRTARSG